MAGAEDFYAGKSLDFLIGADAGGGYDLPGRAIARHLDRHLPGHPTIVVKNIGGAGGLAMTNFLYNAAPRDGTTIGMPTNSMAFEPLERFVSRDGKNIQFDAQKLQWIGTPTRETYVAFVWHTAPAKSVNDLESNTVLMGSTSPAGTNAILPILTNEFLGTHMQVITGYGSQSNIFVALERGEVQGNVTGLTNLTVNRAEWMRDGKARILLQYALSKDASLPDVPSVLDLIENDEDKAAMRFVLAKFQMARPIAAPPGVPQDRVQMLRTAFDQTMKDKAFLEDAAKLGLEIDPMSGDEITALIREMYKTPKPVIERLRNIVFDNRKQAVKRLNGK
jgi:tripartite-type tricarboxylate transporter receptor subunit TctC